jgi:hypothetical protein
MRSNTDDKISRQELEHSNKSHVFKVVEEPMSTMRMQTDVKIYVCLKKIQVKLLAVKNRIGTKKNRGMSKPEAQNRNWP